MIRVPFFLLFSFNKRAQKQKGQKGTTQEPRPNYKGCVSISRSIIKVRTEDGFKVQGLELRNLGCSVLGLMSIWGSGILGLRAYFFSSHLQLIELSSPAYKTRDFNTVKVSSIAQKVTQ